MDETFYVTLTGPAKVNGVREPAGKSVPVTLTVALQLAASGVINADEVTASATPVVDVATIIAERDAHWSTALDHYQTMAEDQQADAIATLKADHLAEVQALEKRAADAEVEAGTLRNRIAELEAATANTPGAKGAAKKA
ncbi:hypothetical protein [Shinella sp. HZN7]|uniref:hypothetical protein n=1 Tax=Shinella sp. (strain HZN7) TaxID=879274 RepID=UPI0007DAADE0|nr:hypothetical protein [Shinella sp. HZN7]ANH04992.1 hypothetical protein shn_13705 [Shinella sp. HZN7]